jgi:hypothetical protein
MSTYELNFDGGILSRGFWLYIWEITTPTGENLYYVGRTGDSSSINAQSPFNRMGQHLGFNANSNVLRKRLTSAVHNLDLEKCRFRLVAHGPLLAEEQSLDAHRRSVNIVAALEKALSDAMKSSGYNVINDVPCRKTLDLVLFDKVRDHFRKYFELL